MSQYFSSTLLIQNLISLLVIPTTKQTKEKIHPCSSSSLFLSVNSTVPIAQVCLSDSISNSPASPVDPISKIYSDPTASHTCITVLAPSVRIRPGLSGQSLPGLPPFSLQGTRITRQVIGIPCLHSPAWAAPCAHQSTQEALTLISWVLTRLYSKVRWRSLGFLFCFCFLVVGIEDERRKLN